MTAGGFLKKQVGASEREGRTRPALRALILGSVAQALRQHYGENYANRCMQSASAIVRLLQRCGIDSVLVQGEACFGQVIGPRLAWSQFGGRPERFHFWSMTKYGELVDLTVHQVHRATGVDPGGAPCPALWWNDATRMPNAFRYLHAPPRGRIAVNLADTEEQRRFEDYLAGAEKAFWENLKSRRRLQLPEVVASVEDLNRLSRSDDPWATVAWRFQDLPLPDWAARRLSELMPTCAPAEGETGVPQ